ncbi:MAG: TIGR01459 family HAD-type hydrolase [Marinicaulis sp.]|nr:TIGR01459 family HAD-type hydrolase [Marinicaulis sp.]
MTETSRTTIAELVSNPEFIDSISELAPGYDAMLCDAWGVIHNGVELFDGVADALVQFRKNRGPVIILTNAPRPSTIIPGQLDRLGLPRGAYDAVVTSGDATRHEIARRLPAPAFKIGPEKDDPLFEGLDIEFAPPEMASFIICTGMVDDKNEEPEDYRELLANLANHNLPMICANPDIVVNWGGRMIWCAGALAQIYSELGGAVIFGGKPHAPIYELACAAVDAARKKPTQRKQMLAIGDGLATDIAGANANNIDAVFVAGDGGIHRGDGSEAAIAAKLAEANVETIAVMRALKW